MAHDAGPARRNGCIDSYKDASTSHIHHKSTFIPWYHLLSVLTHSLSSRCLLLPMVHWSCSPTIQCTKTFQPSCTQQECLWLQRESFSSWTLLTCVAVCKSVQHGTIKSSLFPNSWTKSMPTEGSARRMLKTIIHLRSRWRSLCFPLRGNHLLLSPPTLWHKSTPKRHVQPLSHSSASSLSGTGVGAVGE